MLPSLGVVFDGFAFGMVDGFLLFGMMLAIVMF